MKKVEATFEDYRSGTPPRAFGHSAEFPTRHAVENILDEDNKGTMPQISHFMPPDLYISRGRATPVNAIVSTGGEIYGHNTHTFPLKYAVPECSNLPELIAHKRAGEVIMQRVISSLAKYAGVPNDTYIRSGYARVLRKGAIAMQEYSLGHYETYSSLNVFSHMNENPAKQLNDSPDAKYLADFLALRKIIDGAGMVGEDGFLISQKSKAHHYRKFGNNTSHGYKQAFTQAKGYMTVMSGENSKSDWQTEFAMGLTSLVLRLIEHGSYPAHLQLADPNQAVHDLAKNPHAEVLLKSGIYMKGPLVLKEIVEEAYQDSYGPDLPEIEERAAYRFDDYLKDLDQVSLVDNKVDALADRIGWAGRFKKLNEMGADYVEMKSSQFSLVKADIEWDGIKATDDAAHRHFHKFGHAVLPSQARLAGPPKDTRARPRLEMIRELEPTGEITEVYWGHIRMDDGKYYNFPHPLSDRVVIVEPEE